MRMAEKQKSVGLISKKPSLHVQHTLPLLLQLDWKRSVFFSQNQVKKSVKRGVRVLRSRSSRASQARRAPVGRVRREKKTVCLASPPPSLALRFQSRCRPFVWLLRRFWTRQKYGLFCSLCGNVKLLSCTFCGEDVVYVHKKCRLCSCKKQNIYIYLEFWKPGCLKS